MTANGQTSETRSPRDASGTPDSCLSAFVAFDDSPAATAAVRVAGALAAAGRITPTLVTVNEAMPLIVAAPMPSAAAITGALMGYEGEEERIQTVRRQLPSVLPDAANWPVRLLSGEAATAIDEAAVADHTALVIMGLSRHGAIARGLGLETTLEVVRLDHVSVLGIVPGLEGVPHCIVVGTDFSQASERAARMAARLLAPGGRLVLAYAEAMFDYNAEDREGFGVVHDEGVRGAFERLRWALELPQGATVETHDIDATPTRGLLELADRARADVVAVGRQHHSVVSRLLLPSVATDVLRDARYSVLATASAPWSPRPRA